MGNCPACQASIVVEAAPNAFVSCVICGELLALRPGGELRVITAQEISNLPDQELMFVGMLARSARILKAVDEALKGTGSPDGVYKIRDSAGRVAVTRPDGLTTILPSFKRGE